MTPEISKIRNKPMGRDIVGALPAFRGLRQRKISKLWCISFVWRLMGVLSALRSPRGHIEKDLAFCVFAEPDFITIDGRGGATGSSPLFLRDSSSLPTVYALYRARKYLDSVGSGISLVITGGLRVSSDFAKAIAMGG